MYITCMCMCGVCVCMCDVCVCVVCVCMCMCGMCVCMCGVCVYVWCVYVWCVCACVVCVYVWCVCVCMCGVCVCVVCVCVCLGDYQTYLYAKVTNNINCNQCVNNSNNINAHDSHSLRLKLTAAALQTCTEYHGYAPNTLHGQHPQHSSAQPLESACLVV